LDIEEIKRLIGDLESDRVERTSSFRDRDKIRKAICAFSNDLPNYKIPGYFIIGVDDDGNFTDTPISDDQLLKLADIRNEGKILPTPSFNVQKIEFDGHFVAVIEVFPSYTPPIRVDGVIWIRIGPRRGISNQDEERRLSEKRISGTLSFDNSPISNATINDLDLKLFSEVYLPSAIKREVLDENNRSVEEQLISLRFLTPNGKPTNGGMLMTGKDPQNWIPGAYAQFVRFDGNSLTDPVLDQKVIIGALGQQLREIDEITRINIETELEIKDYGPDAKYPDYPIKAIQQIIRNAVMHRSYESTNAPVRFYWFSDRIEIQNPGGLYGQVNEENFDKVTDYRNPLIAEAMRVLSFVQKFGVGIQIAKSELFKNGNPNPEFLFTSEYTLVTIRRRR
jgi:ATP-dependent DNA helicase RecG